MKKEKLIELLELKMKQVQLPEEIDVIYIYGSIIKGKLRIDSDIDIAILTNVGIDINIKLELISQIEAIFKRLFEEIGFKQEVSILDLNNKYLSIELAYEIVTEGVPIYSKNSVRRFEFENYIKREYFDFIPYLRFLRNKKYGHLLQKT